MLNIDYCILPLPVSPPASDRMRLGKQLNLEARIGFVGRNGLKMQHYYGEQSCTAGGAAFLTGQHGIRTGLTKVGFPGMGCRRSTASTSSSATCTTLTRRKSPNRRSG
ncbi:hypothetical protein ABIB66_000996 [Bradyrhizobium sp. F1.13.3]